MNSEVLANKFSLDPFERYAEASMEADDDLPTSPSTQFFQELFDSMSCDTSDDLVEDQTGEVSLPMDESDPLSSTNDVCSLIDFESKYSPNQTMNLEVLPDDPTSQPLELGAPRMDMPETLESEVPGSRASSQPFKLGALSTDMSQTLESQVPGSHASSRSLELGAPQPNQTSQSLEVQVFADVPASPSFLNGSNQQHHLHAQQYQNVPPTPQFCGYYHQSPTPSNELLGPRISCRCKKSACLKGYCSCYKAKVGCSDMCQCEGCGNTYGCKNGGITSSFNSSAAQRDLPSNSISLVNEKPLGGGLDTLAHNSLNICANQNIMYGAPTLNQFAPPPAVKMAQLPANLFAPPLAVQIVNVAYPQENPFALSSNISPPQAVHKTANAQLQANPFAPTYTAYQPQQQHILMNSANSFVNDATYGVFGGNADSRTPLKQLPLRFRKEVNDIYWKLLPRE